MKKLFILAATITISGLALLLGLFFIFEPNFLETKPPIPQQRAEPREETRFIHTAYFPLKVKRIPLPREIRKKYDGGSIAKIGDNALVQKGHLFFHLDLKTHKFTQLNITPPNIRAGATWGYKNILIVKQPKKTILLFSYSYFDEKKCRSLRVGRVEFSNDQNPLQWKAAADDWKVIFETKPCRNIETRQMAAAMSLSSKPNHIFVSGRFLWVPNPYESDYDGPIFEININTGKKQKIASGLRITQGLALDTKKRLWAVEHGPRGGDELNLIKKGKNYGWPFVSYGTDYGTYSYRLHKSSKTQGKHEGYEKPIYSFIPSIGISNLTLIDDFEPEWDGDLLAASMRAGTLFRFRIVRSRVVLVEPIKLGPRIRFIYNHGDGVLIALSDNGNIFILQRDRPTVQYHKLFAPLSAGPQEARGQATWKKCVVCHSQGQASTDRAPSLSNVLGREVGKSDFAHYSPAFKAAKGVWTEWRLWKFLRNPDKLFSGTTMPHIPMEPAVTKAIIDHLKSLKAHDTAQKLKARDPPR